jgi:D-serine dehydratase
MQAFAEAAGVRLAPHGKTTMCPALYELQIEAGAWGITVGTPHQLRVARSFGFRRLLLANQLVGRSAIEWVIDEIQQCPDFDFYCLLDSATNLEQLTAAARRKKLSRPLQLLLEIGFAGGRTGCRSVQQALELAAQAHQRRDVIALRGVEGFEGIIRASDDSATTRQVDAFLDRILECAQLCAERNLFAPGEVLLSAGGSAFFDRVAEKLGRIDLKRSKLVLLRGGCYLTHDHTMYARAFEQMRSRAAAAVGANPGLLPALEVWTYVQSLPEAGRAIAMMGKRDVSYDDLPTPIKWYRPGVDVAGIIALDSRYSVSHLNDQHCHVNVPADCPWRVGDMVAFGISHPCLTFDKWRVLHIVDDQYQVLSSVRTYF